MSITAFRKLGAVPNARVLLDPKRDELKTRRRTLLNRAVDWIRGKVTRDPLAEVTRIVPHNRFLRAIAESPAYDAGDISRAEALLSVDLLGGKALTTRRIVEVLDDLDGRSTQAVRDNRTTAAWMSNRGVDERLGELSASALPEEDRRVVASRVAGAIKEAGGAGDRAVGFERALSITAGVVDEFLAEKERTTARSTPPDEVAEAEATGPAETAAQAGEPNVPAVPDPMHEDEPVAGPPAPTAAPTASVRVWPGRAEGVPPKALLRELDKAKLPRVVAKDVRRLVKAGSVRDRTDLARRANLRTAAWILENRVGRWYGEALKRAGARRKIKHGEQLMASSRMLDKVNRSIVEADRLLPYAEVKGQARALIADHVGGEVAGGVP